MTDETESNVTATLEAIIGRVPEADVLLDQLVGVRFEGMPRPMAMPTTLIEAMAAEIDSQCIGASVLPRQLRHRS